MTYPTLIRLPWQDPVAVLAAQPDEPWLCGLISDGSGPWARWSYVLRQPKAILEGQLADPFAALQALQGSIRAVDPSGPPFQGGVIGLGCYELAAHVEALTLRRRAGWPDLSAARFDQLLAFDHAHQRVFAIGDTRALAQKAADDLVRPTPLPNTGPLARSMMAVEADDRYLRAVADVVCRIAAGEIFQANLARAWQGELNPQVTPMDVLVRLSVQSPAPFAAYLRFAGRALVSNSPERFVGLTAGGQLESRPIKGSRARGVDPAADRLQIQDLVTSAKDRAENLMIVDLMRNDLARVSSPGSVRVPDLFAVETFANVHHLVSTIQAQLTKGRSAVDVLRACFPPGSITGAPKVQAMRVIAESEPPRGPYCGSLFWWGRNGAMDSNVLIRSLALQQAPSGWRFETWAGAGLVADSDPQSELDETTIKMLAIRRALMGHAS